MLNPGNLFALYIFVYLPACMISSRRGACSWFIANSDRIRPAVRDDKHVQLGGFVPEIECIRYVLETCLDIAAPQLDYDRHGS
jgi:hypothetical protein